MIFAERPAGFAFVATMTAAIESSSRNAARAAGSWLIDTIVP